MKRNTLHVNFVKLLGLVHEELVSSADRFGCQNHPTIVNMMVLGEEVGEAAELIETLEDGININPNALIQELIQVAAMAIMVADSVKRNGYRSPKSVDVPRLPKAELALSMLAEGGKTARQFLEEEYVPSKFNARFTEALE